MFRELTDKAAAALVDGINAGNPDHESFSTPCKHRPELAGQVPLSQENDTERLGKLTMGTGAIIAAGSLGLEASGVGLEYLSKFGTGGGLGGSCGRRRYIYYGPPGAVIK